METILRVIFIVGVLQSLIACVWFIIVAFRESLRHGLLMFFFLEIYALIFSITHWEEAKKPFFSLLIGVTLMFGSVLLKPMLAAGNAYPDDPEASAIQAAPSDFKRKLAMAIVSKVAANVKRGSPQASAPSFAHPDANPMPDFQPVPVQPADSQAVTNAPAPKKSLIPFISREPAKPAPTPSTTNEWDQARALLRVTGTLKTGKKHFATVNRSTVTIGDEVAVTLNGRVYRFKVRAIDLHLNTVEFDPVE